MDDPVNPVPNGEKSVLKEVILQVQNAQLNPCGPTGCSRLADILCERRPYRNRREMEEMIFRFTGHYHDNGIDPPVGDPRDAPLENLPEDAYITERQFNDILNSLAGITDDDESIYDVPGTPGLYAFNGWAEGDSGWLGRSQTGGKHTDRYGTEVTTSDRADNITYSTEIKFTSRYFHIYSLGRSWNASGIDMATGLPGVATGVRRCHAIYDAGENPATDVGKIIWFRWNLTERGTISDQ
jgi:hypothetical protein